VSDITVSVFYPGVAGCELPVDPGIEIIPVILPGGYDISCFFNWINPATQALACEYIKLNLAMSRRLPCFGV
jgi:hypothetical protein